MAGWHHWLDGRESEWTPGVSDGQGGLACCVSWGGKELDTTERLILSDLMVRLYVFSVFCSISDSILLANHGFLENCFFELTYRNSWCHIIFSSVQNLLLLYHLFPLLTIARSAGDLPFSPTEPLTTLFHSVLCSWQRLVHMGCNNGFPCPPSSCWVWLLVDQRHGEGNAPHSSTLAWKIPWTEEPGRLQSIGSLRVGYDWVTSLSLFSFMHWRRKWQPTPVFLPGEFQGRGSLVGCRLWGRTESDMTEAT